MQTKRAIVAILIECGAQSAFGAKLHVVDQEGEPTYRIAPIAAVVER